MGGEQIVLEIENLGKKYRLGKIGSGTLSHDVQEFLSRFHGKEIPSAEKPDQQDYIWALHDVDLSVKKGEVLGIIGRNGAGKSTLLKLLSRVTQPTEGTIKARGRIASLLEVGTGMHPELSGRENIFLNGAILGMSREEIENRFEEIVDFSGCRTFLDTPLKRYSSGMKVRLGFSVAAFLEPEILIVDEVLAVGDVEFQKKAIARMREVSSGGNRTVLFVSHNMASIKTLCTRCVVFDQGRLVFDGDVDEAISRYLGYNQDANSRLITWEESPAGSEEVFLRRAEIRAENKTIDEPFSITDPLKIEIELNHTNPDRTLDCTLQIHSEDGVFLAASSTLFEEASNHQLSSGHLIFSCQIPPRFFNQGSYKFSLLIVADRNTTILRLEDLFKVSFVTAARSPGDWMGTTRSYLLPQFEWDKKQV